MKLKAFQDAIAGLLKVEGIAPIALIGVWQAYANNDEWLFGLSDKEFNQFIGFMDILYEVFK